MARRTYGQPRIDVELANVCNLHCGYCLRDENALHHDKPQFLSIDLLRRVLREAREANGITNVAFTGGEPTLHPRFADVLATVRAEGLTTSFVTNGWHFERLWPTIQSYRDTVTHIAFSLDGATRAAHDRWRGEGSFVRLVRAFSRCRRAELPFVIKTVIRKDTLPQLEQIAILAARMGATSLNFGHLLPTSPEFEELLGLTAEDRTIAEQEVALLAQIFKMQIVLDVGYYNIDPAAPCSALAIRSCNVDYLGRLSLCCNLSGYRGAVGEADIVADLNQEPFAPAFARLKDLAATQLARRRKALAEFAETNVKPDLDIGSPCLFCLMSFAKAPWHAPLKGPSRTLPVISS